MKRSAFLALGLSLMLVSLSSVSAEPMTSPPASPKAEPFEAAKVWKDIRADLDLYYAYRDKRGVDADTYFDRLGERLVRLSDPADFRRELNRATYAFTDPHFIVGPLQDGDFNVFPTASDLIVMSVGDRFMVTDVRAGSDAARAGVRPGWALLSTEGRDVASGLADVFDGLVDAPDRRQRGYGATLLANGRRGQGRCLRFAEPDGTVRPLNLPSPQEFARRVIDLPQLVVDRPAPGVVRLVVNNSLGDNAVVAKADALFRELGPVDGFILDLRNTPSGGNTIVAQAIMGHLVREPRAYQVHDYPSMEREFSVPRRSVEYVLPRAPFIAASLVVLSGHWTGSMGEGMVIGLDAAADAETISSPMGKLLGGLSNFSYADNRIKLDMGTYTLSHLNGTPREDYVADEPLPAADRTENGNDPALAAALRHLAAKR